MGEEEIIAFRSSEDVDDMSSTELEISTIVDFTLVVAVDMRPSSDGKKCMEVMNWKNVLVVVMNLERADGCEFVDLW